MSTHLIKDIPAGATCVPNISHAGRRRRIFSGYVGVALTAGLLVGFHFFHAAWYVRLALFFPAAMAAFGFLQARRNTCVARAAQGVIEHEDFSQTPAPPDQLSASRKVAATIRRDSLLIALAAAFLGAATALA